MKQKICLKYVMHSLCGMEWRWEFQKQIAPQRADSRDDIFPPRHYRRLNLLDADSAFLGESIMYSEPTNGLKLFVKRKDWVHSNSYIMINSATLFLCLCLTAFILSFRELSQLASGHGKIFVASEYEYIPSVDASFSILLKLSLPFEMSYSYRWIENSI